MNFKFSKDRGFSLLEILIALAILAISLVGLYTSQGNALKASAAAQHIQVATLLARNQMTQMLIDLERDRAKGSFPKEKEEESGTFEAPYEDYQWKWTVEEVEIPIGPPPSPEQEEENPAVAGKTAGSNTMTQVTQMVSKQIKEALRVVRLEVSWEAMGKTESITLTSHVVNL